MNEHNSSPADIQKNKLICQKERTFLRQLISVLPWRSLSSWHSSKQQAAPSEVPLRHDAEHQTANYPAETKTRTARTPSQSDLAGEHGASMKTLRIITRQEDDAVAS
jgi:hypothetical protein